MMWSRRIGRCYWARAVTAMDFRGSARDITARMSHAHDQRFAEAVKEAALAAN